MHIIEGTLGCESVLVQAKLGHDLRLKLRATFEAGLPIRMQRLVDDLLGYAEFSEVEGEASAAGRCHPDRVGTASVERWRDAQPACGYEELLSSDTIAFPRR